MTTIDAEFASDERYIVSDVSESTGPSRTGGAGLTPREIEIIQLLAEGRSNKQMAQELGLSVRTVESHRLHVMRKLHVRSLVQLLYYAMDHSIVSRR